MTRTVLAMVALTVGVTPGQARKDATQDFATERAAFDQEFAKEALKAANDLIKAKALAEARSFIALAGTRTEEQKDEFAKLVEKCDPKAKAKWDKASDQKIKDFGRAMSPKLTALVKKYAKEDAAAIRRLDVEAEIAFDLADYVRALWHVNELRIASGAPETSFSWDLSRGCWLHAKYLTLNPKDGWQEDEAKKGFTEEGKKAGQNGSYWPGRGLLTTIDGLFQNAWPKIWLLRPNMKTIGLGMAGGTTPVSVIDARSGVTGPDGEADFVTISPADKAMEVPLAAEPEGDDPVPSGSRPVGFPIVLTVWDADARVVDVKTQLVEGGKVIDCHVSTPESPALAKLHATNMNSIVLFPKKPLKGNATFAVSIEYKTKAGAVKKQWTFRTAAK